MPNIVHFILADLIAQPSGFGLPLFEAGNPDLEYGNLHCGDTALGTTVN